MSKILNDGLDQYGPEHFEQQQFWTAGVEGITLVTDCCLMNGVRSSGWQTNWRELLDDWATRAGKLDDVSRVSWTGRV